MPVRTRGSAVPPGARHAQVAQSVEHLTENQGVGGSNPPLGTIRAAPRAGATDAPDAIGGGGDVLLEATASSVGELRNLGDVRRSRLGEVGVRPDICDEWLPVRGTNEHRAGGVRPDICDEAAGGAVCVSGAARHGTTPRQPDHDARRLEARRQDGLWGQSRCVTATDGGSPGRRAPLPAVSERRSARRHAFVTQQSRITRSTTRVICSSVL